MYTHIAVAYQFEHFIFFLPRSYDIDSDKDKPNPFPHNKHHMASSLIHKYHWLSHYVHSYVPIKMTEDQEIAQKSE